MNSARLWVARQRREGRLGRRDLGRALVWFAMYRLGRARMEDVIHSAATTLAGEDEATLRAATERFWHEELATLVRPGARRVLDRHRAEGAQLVLLTASSGQLGAACQEALDLHHALTNVFEVEQGRFTGTLRVPLCFGPGKTVHARAHAEAQGVALSDCSFYTDSVSDLDMLEAVGTPVVVDPDPRLARIARRRGWEHADWD